MARFADNSTILNYGEIIDCRCLTLAIEFFELAQDDVCSLSEDAVKWLQEFLGEDFVTQWRINRRATAARSFPEVLHSKFSNGNRLQFHIEGYLKSPLVYNLRSYRQISHYLNIPGLPGIRENPTLALPPEYLHASKEKQRNRETDWQNVSGEYSDYFIWNGDPGESGFHSADYLTFWKELFEDRPCNGDEICRRIFKLFGERGRYYQNTYLGVDMYASFWAFPYRNIRELYRGSFAFHLSSHCAGKYKDEVARLLIAFSEEISKKYGNVNARVMLQPVYDGNSPYMHYFGSNRLGDGSYRETNQLPDEWYESYYMRGVEWCNILSSRIMTHLPDLERDSSTVKNVQLKNLGNGSYMLRAAVGIDSYDVNEALDLKRLVADALYPGGTSCSLSRLFPKDGIRPKLLRKDWAIVPLFENEIEVIAKDLVFCAYSRRN